jgi:glycosyltransferase involved in cell wall biosynthesis
VHIGFFGTVNHSDNVSLLDGVLEPILDRYPETRVVEVGGPHLIPRVNAHARQLVHLGSVSFCGFPLALQQMDIVLAPLANTPVMQCKSNIRCLTAGIAGLPVVASPVGAYADYIEHGVNGFLAGSPDEWSSYIEELVEDRELRCTMGTANRLRARAFAISGNVHHWIRVYEEVFSRRHCS